MSSKDKQSPHEIKANALAGATSGIQEKIAHDAAVEEVESRKAPGEEDSFEGKEGLEGDTGEDKIEVEVEEEEKEEKEEEEEVIVKTGDISEEDEDNIDFWKERAGKFEKKFRTEKKFRKKSVGNLKGKLTSMERAVEPRTTPPVDAKDDVDIFEAAGIEDPEEPMTAKQSAKLMELTMQRQGRVTARETVKAQTTNDVAVRVAKSIKAAQKEHEDFDEVVNQFSDLTDPKSPEFDETFTNMILDRKDPAEAMYEWSLMKLGKTVESKKVDNEDEDSEDDERIEKALKRREKKRETLTMNRSGKGGSGKRPRKKGSAEKTDIFSRMTDGSDAEALALEDEYGGEA